MIHDVAIKQLQVNPDEWGDLTEVWRSDLAFFQGVDEPEMAEVSTTYPGAVRAWERHSGGQIDHFVVPNGRVKVGIFDDRSDSPTEGELDTYLIGDGNMVALRVPGDCWHGFKTLGDEPAILINFPTTLYDYDDPDEEHLPADTDRIPNVW
jgi:dTDP-4-dehydrorhamnose 3,5-epimerase